MARQVFADPFGAYQSGYEIGAQREALQQRQMRDVRDSDYNFYNILPVEQEARLREEAFQRFNDPNRRTLADLGVDQATIARDIGINNRFMSDIGAARVPFEATNTVAPVNDIIAERFGLVRDNVMTPDGPAAVWYGPDGRQVSPALLDEIRAISDLYNSDQLGSQAWMLHQQDMAARRDRPAQAPAAAGPIGFGSTAAPKTPQGAAQSAPATAPLPTSQVAPQAAPAPAPLPRAPMAGGGPAPVNPLLDTPQLPQYQGIDEVLAILGERESGNNYQAQNSTTSASGKYQYIDSTWGNYGGYPRAALAPPEVQEQKAREDWARRITKYDGDVFKAIAEHYLPARANDPTRWRESMKIGDREVQPVDTYIRYITKGTPLEQSYDEYMQAYR